MARSARPQFFSVPSVHSVVNAFTAAPPVCAASCKRSCSRAPDSLSRLRRIGSPRMKDDTLLAQLGRHSLENHGIVNPPVYRASTILFADMAAREAAIRDGKRTYGLGGTPTTEALEETVAALEHGDRAIALGSGPAAITVALLAFLEAGDHVLL